MGKKKKNLIPKNRDIEDIIFEEDNKSIKNMEDVVETIKEEKTTKTEREQFTDEIRASIDKKVENYCKRKESQSAEQKRQTELYKAIERNKQEEENSL